MIHGSLFAGIGGFDLGFSKAGIKTIWAVEIDLYCQKVLKKNFPDTKIYSDIKECGVHNLEKVDIISGGFPCQDISVAGKKAGITGSRSGLWSEMFRIIGELRPRYAVIENVPNLVNLGLETVLCDLASIGYDAEWQIISAAEVGAWHLRKRIWIIAYPSQKHDGEDSSEPGQGQIQEFGNGSVKGDVPNSSSLQRARKPGEICGGRQGGNGFGNILQTLSDSDKQRQQARGKLQECGKKGQLGWRNAENTGQWESEPQLGRVADGIPHRVDRLRGLGNAIVPQIAEIIGRKILEAEKQGKR